MAPKGFVLWIPHDRRGRRGRRHEVSIWPRGTLNIGIGVIEQYHLEGYRYVVRFLDREMRHIGLRVTHDSTEAGVVRLHQVGRGYTVAVGPLLMTLDLQRPRRTMPFPVWYSVPDGLLVIDVSSLMATVPSDPRSA